ncbi:MAG: hypothetical protein ACI3YA_04095 [Alloprevotella sp.]
MKEKGKAGCFTEFIFHLLAVVVALASFALVIGGYFTDNMSLTLIGIGLSVVFALLIFIIPFLRRNAYIRWLAFAGLGDAA